MSKPIVPLDPDTDAGRAAAEAISQALAEIQVAEIQVAVWRRQAEAARGAKR